MAGSSSVSVVVASIGSGTALPCAVAKSVTSSPPAPSTALTPVHPVGVAGKLNAPVLGLYGGADTGIPLDSVEAMKTALAAGSAAAKASQFVVYPDTPHAFHADYRPSYRKEAAQDGWKRLTQWLKANGV